MELADLANRNSERFSFPGSRLNFQKPPVSEVASRIGRAHAHRRLPRKFRPRNDRTNIFNLFLKPTSTLTRPNLKLGHGAAQQLLPKQAAGLGAKHMRTIPGLPRRLRCSTPPAILEFQREGRITGVSGQRRRE